MSGGQTDAALRRWEHGIHHQQRSVTKFHCSALIRQTTHRTSFVISHQSLSTHQLSSHSQFNLMAVRPCSKTEIHPTVNNVVSRHRLIESQTQVVSPAAPHHRTAPASHHHQNPAAVIQRPFDGSPHAAVAPAPPCSPYCRSPRAAWLHGAAPEDGSIVTHLENYASINLKRSPHSGNAVS